MSEVLSVRAARPADLDAIADLQARAIMAEGEAVYGREACRAWAKLGGEVRHGLLRSGTFFVAESDGRLGGVAGWSADSRDADCAWPRYVFVDPNRARRGVGRSLMAAVEISARAAGRPRLQLWSSLNAVGFYQRLGFKAIRRAHWPLAGGIEMAHLLMEKDHC